MFTRMLAGVMPKGLYARSLLIVILPMVLLQSAVALVFMERHWQMVTFRLSNAVTQDIAALIDIYRDFHSLDPDNSKLEDIARRRLKLDAEILPPGPLPPALPKPFFSLVDRAMSSEIQKQIHLPFWIDTVGRSDFIEVRVDMGDAILRVVALRSQAYASNTHIFIIWMVGTSLVLITVAILFLRNQIRPILALADAAEEFGKGREIEFRPRGAREVRRAAYAFLEMKRRIERAMEQRTTMLNGVSHDLRTILTRFKLSLALLGDDAEAEELTADVNEMQRMLEAYLAFARGDIGEGAAPTDIPAMLETLRQEGERLGHDTEVLYSGEPVATVRPDAFKRCLANLLNNAARHGDRIRLEGSCDTKFLQIHIDDDGPGIPAGAREDVFRPFVRLDEARNQDEGGTGLGLAIARDIARSHGGEIFLSTSPLGGLRASVRVPV
ncbi:two-component sensor histidine kinase [Rhodoblastus acidophilus]|uniref:histidine kinase n=1 Tax=Candidatus Rhodoblastus alkanivorans TaxID=2954117 RepID=A0ABS9Z564_9HYPH|nr:ATP-binding protein [Candidatus Rhodoblastus alkanivorans]MCI4680319.1 two-component sensor histidine kinase [Candidatus Rhodoblastus alkanivorans]MCI4682774.1 two-component sensor histidine kinase [Candidatus Rhodoblastus alkanivorans]MDI4640081.1 two-component sensor histidine kinase [Rhodoblastus acidophilus]